jgi:cytochrome c553
MRRVASNRLARIAKWSLAIAMSLAVAGLLFAWSGAYNVAASQGHWAVVEWALRFGMRNSVALRAPTGSPPGLDDPSLVRLGAAHFETGCAFCHGSPESKINPVTEQMLPSPPNLSTEMRPWTDGELFWIVRHGIKYTGMPGWVAIERADEIWAVVAFLKVLPTLDRARYQALAFGSMAAPSLIESTAKRIPVEQSALVCGRCHGVEGKGPESDLVPSLHGQPAAFLVAALRDYANGQRRSGIMEPLVADLKHGDVDRLARYYAGLAPPAAQPSTAEAALMARGELLATSGDPAVGLPACNACHGRDALDSYPRLAGQNARYMKGQLQLWKAGSNTAGNGAAIMAPIARLMSDRDIEAATSYFAALPTEAAKAAPP